MKQCFETIRNSTALKQTGREMWSNFSFETIRNSTALKPIASITPLK